MSTPKFNLAYRWFCRLGLEADVPDHSTFSKNRHGRFPEAETFRYVFEQVLKRCMAGGLIGDTAYGTAAMLNWIVDIKQIELHTPVWQRYEGEAGMFGMADFTWEADRYVCPAGKLLQRYRRNFKNKRTGITKANTIIYRATEHDCGACEYKSSCCSEVPRRKITRSIYESSREVARENHP